MRRQVWLGIAGVMLLLSLLFVPACGEDDDNDDGTKTAEDYVEQGQKELRDNDATHAGRSFVKALDMKPSLLDAEYGLLLVGPQRFFNFLDEIVATINAISFNPENNEFLDEKRTRKSLEEDTPDDYVEHPIHQYFIDKLFLNVERADIAYERLADQAQYLFEQELYEYSITGNPVMSFGGEFDQTDIAFFGGLNSLFKAVCGLILASDFRYDYKVLAIEFGGDGDTFDTLDMVFGLLNDLLVSETHPTFLMVQPVVGETRMAQTGIDFGNAFARLAAAVDLLALETDDQSDDQFAYRDANGNGVYDPDEDPLWIGQSIEIPPALGAELPAILNALATAFYEGSPYDDNPNEVTTLGLSDLGRLLEALGILPIDLGDTTIDELPDILGGVNVGGFFADPPPEGIRILVELLVDLYYNPGDVIGDLDF